MAKKLNHSSACALVATPLVALAADEKYCTGSVGTWEYEAIATLLNTKWAPPPRHNGRVTLLIHGVKTNIIRRGQWDGTSRNYVFEKFQRRVNKNALGGVSLGVISTPTARMCYYNLTKRGALNCYHQAASVFSSLATDREMKNNMVHVHLMGVELQITPLLILYLGNLKHCAALCLIKLANWRSVIRCESADFHCTH